MCKIFFQSKEQFRLKPGWDRVVLSIRCDFGCFHVFVVIYVYYMGKLSEVH